MERFSFLYLAGHYCISLREVEFVTQADDNKNTVRVLFRSGTMQELRCPSEVEASQLIDKFIAGMHKLAAPLLNNGLNRALEKEFNAQTATPTGG